MPQNLHIKTSEAEIGNFPIPKTGTREVCFDKK